MLTSTGKPVKHAELLIGLLTAIKLPSALAICKCAAHKTGTDLIVLGNNYADKVAKLAASGKYGTSDAYATIVEPL